jgi:Leucine rich repeat
MSIEKADLESFENLTELLLDYNLLQVLESDLFESNPKLKYFNLDYNKLLILIVK